MALKNLSPAHYTPTERSSALLGLTAIETALAAKFKSLSTEDRIKYGSVHEQNKLFINKVKDLRNSQPGLSCLDIDWTEFQNDLDSREFLQNFIMRLETLTQNLKNNKILHDYDNFRAALVDYDYSKFKANSNISGYESKVNELGQFFGRTVTQKEKKENDTPT